VLSFLNLWKGEEGMKGMKEVEKEMYGGIWVRIDAPPFVIATWMSSIIPHLPST